MGTPKDNTCTRHNMAERQGTASLFQAKTYDIGIPEDKTMGTPKNNTCTKLNMTEKQGKASFFRPKHVTLVYQRIKQWEHQRITNV